VTHVGFRYERNASNQINTLNNQFIIRGDGFMNKKPYSQFFIELIAILMLSTSIYSQGWKQLDAMNLPCAGMAYSFDEERNRGVVFGGENPTITSNTYEWNGKGWTFIADTGPSPRVNTCMVYNSQLKKMLLFGGWCKPDDYYDDTWEWDGVQWQQISASGPSSRANCAIAYDKARNKVVLFGGSCYQSIYGDTWEYDGTTQSWSQVSTSGPSPRIYSRMVYDENREVIVLFGGESTYPKESQVRIEVYDLNGRVVERLVNRKMPPGEYTINWNADNFISGVYFYRITAGDYSEVRKCVLIK